MIKVGKLREFTDSNWREAILFFLFSRWSSNKIFEKCPEISFNGLTIRLEGKNEQTLRYLDAQYCIKNPKKNEVEVPNIFPCKNVLWLEHPNAAEVEVGLARFVKDEQIRVFSIHTLEESKGNYTSGCITLWKGEARGECEWSGLNAMHKLGHLWHG